MRATKPIPIDTTAKFTSSTATEPHDPAAYSAAVAYAFGDIRKVVADYAIYEYLQPYDAAVVGQTPSLSPRYWKKIGPTETAYDNTKTNYPLGATCSFDHRCYESLVLQTAVNPLPIYPETETAFWIYVQPTNKWAIFDGDTNTQTVHSSFLTDDQATRAATPSTIVVVVTPGQRINTIGLTRMVANTVTIKVTSASQLGTIYPLAYDATGHIYAKDECMTVGLTTCYQSKADNNLNHPAPDTDWWLPVDGAVFSLNGRIGIVNATTYFYTPFTTRPEKTVIDVPLVTDCVVTVTLTATQGNVKCAALTCGINNYIGQLQKPVKNEGKSFSTVTRDLYSKATLVKRPMIRKLTGTLLLPSYLIDRALQVREELDATPALYNGVDEDGDWTAATTLFGVHQDFTINTTPGLEAEISFMAEEI